jgi:mannose-1-phosphate guanylyltransferase
MKAVILVGGEGTRLRPLTCNIPKALVPILNRPFLEHLLQYLSSYGIQEVILAMGYQPDSIRECLGDGNRLGVCIHYSVEDSPLGTAGAVKLAAPYLDDTFVVFNGDIITAMDLGDMIGRHRQCRPVASIALTPVDNPSIYGVVETDAAGMVGRFVEKPRPEEATTNMINAGIYVLEPEVLEMVPAMTHSMFERDIFPRLLAEGRPVLGYPSSAYWIDIGSPEKYLMVQHDLLLGQGDEVRFEGECRIHPSARLEGPLLSAGGCIIEEGVVVQGPAVLGANCHIGRGAVVEGSVLWDRVVVKEGARLHNCIAGSGSRVLQDCSLPEGIVLGENARVPDGSKLPRSARVWPDGRIEVPA